ncbi:hypothetical protein ABZ208_30335 [Streptomyces sp. NPDC006208]|uniref:hypothetical protein n=1 Tax=Streptomyces sp. NPDC006208 TaxID=3156734 RepID=UPI0033AFFA5B
MLASGRAYEPHGDARRPLADESTGDPRTAARHFTETAMRRAIATSRAVDPSRPYADNATVLVADISR